MEQIHPRRTLRQPGSSYTLCKSSKRCNRCFYVDYTDSVDMDSSRFGKSEDWPVTHFPGGKSVSVLYVAKQIMNSNHLIVAW
jgi:hypothetical protein